MPELHISLFGTFQVQGSAQTPLRFPTQKVRALLAYVSVEAQSAHPREKLMALFWPEQNQTSASNNLRQTLSRLRTLLPANTLLVQDDGIQFNLRSDHTVDVARFLACLRLGGAMQAGKEKQPTDGPVWQAFVEATNLYQGDFLAHFGLPDSPAFEEWTLLKREWLRSEALTAFARLTDHYEQTARYRDAIRTARRQIEIDSLREEAHQQLMRNLALAGQRSEALEQFELCRRILQQELGVEPAQATLALTEQIRNGQWLPPTKPPEATAATQLLARPAPPNSGTPLAQTAPSATPPLRHAFVGRQREWQQVQHSWQHAAQGRSGLIVIAGEAGIGKSRLAEELLDWVRQQGGRTVQTRSYAAAGALAYAPITDWLRNEQLRLAWLGLEPVWLTELARLMPELLSLLPTLPTPEPLSESWQRKRLFEALGRAVIAATQPDLTNSQPLPLLLILDDLQWCDSETLDWLHFLLHFAPNAPLLLVATLRPEEITPSHPVTGLLLALRRSDQISEIELSPLSQSETATLARFIGGDSLNEESQRRIFADTAGNPLFVVETVRDWEHQQSQLATSPGQATENKELPRASTSQPALTLPIPAKVYAVIQHRLAQLSPAAREVAGLGAIVGRAFTVPLLCGASDLSEEAVVQALDELWRRRILREGQADSYDFSHDRIRDVANAELSPMRRRLHHRRVAGALARLHADHLGPVQAHLAAHYEQAGQMIEAANCYEAAAKVADTLFALADQIVYLKKAVILLNALPTTHARLQQRFGLLITLVHSRVNRDGIGDMVAFEEECLEAVQISEALNRPLDSYFANRALLHAVGLPGNYPKALTVCGQMQRLAETLGDPILVIDTAALTGMNHFMLGDLRVAQSIWEPYATVDLFRLDTKGYSQSTQNQMGSELQTSYAGLLWLLGYPDQALVQVEGALSLIRTYPYPFTLANNLDFSLWTFAGLHHWTRMQEALSEELAIGVKHEMVQFVRFTNVYFGWLDVLRGGGLAAIQAMENGIQEIVKTNQMQFISFQYMLLIKACLFANEVARGLAAVSTALELVNRIQERFWQAEILRLAGELILRNSADEMQAASHFQQALDLARQQSARSLELRAAISLARLWQRQGQAQAAHQLLAEIYGWFREGFATPDLCEARDLLQNLAAQATSPG